MFGVTYEPNSTSLSTGVIEHPRPPPMLHQFLRNTSMILELRNIFTHKYFGKNAISGAIFRVRRSHLHSKKAL